MAQLLRDPGNPVDAGAVAVFVDSDHVGYIPRVELGYSGQSLYGALARLANQRTPATCWARLNGGTPDKPHVGISLFTGCEDEPDKPYAFSLTVPPDAWASVLGVEQRQQLLGQLLAGRTEAFVGSVLTVADSNPSRRTAGGPVLMVAVNGSAIGGLSPKESAVRLPIIQALAEAGRPAHALARVRNSSGQRGGVICSVSTVAVPVER